MADPHVRRAHHRARQGHGLCHPAADRLERSGAACLAVGRREAIEGLLTRDRVVAAVAGGRGGEPVGPMAVQDWAHVHADHAIDVVLDRFRKNSAGVLPVLNRADVRRLDGVITRETLMTVFGSKRVSDG